MNATAPTITETVRATIKNRGLTAYAIGKAGGLQPHMVKRFMDGLDVRAETLDKICHALGLVLVERLEMTSYSNQK